MSKEKSLIALAQRFHTEYERLAPSFGYETRPETRVFDPESPNGKLMIAVCSALAPPDAQPAIAPAPISLTDVDSIAERFAASYASLHHFVMSVVGLRDAAAEIEKQRSQP